MDMAYGSEQAGKFVKNVGLVTTRGAFGDDIMACEWTYQVSYSPGQIAVCIGRGKMTSQNINSSKEFGVSLAAEDQLDASAVSGGSKGDDVDKIAVLQELGFKFSQAKKIKALLLEGAALTAECKLVNTVELPTHTMFIGEVLEVSVSPKQAVAYQIGKYFKLGAQMPKPSDEHREKIKSVIEKHPRKK